MREHSLRAPSKHANYMVACQNTAVLETRKRAPADFQILVWDADIACVAQQTQVDTGENQRRLGRTHFDRNGIVVYHRKLKIARRFKSFVPNCQTIAIPVENLEAVTTLIHE